MLEGALHLQLMANKSSHLKAWRGHAGLCVRNQPMV